MELRHLHPHLPILAALLTDQPGGELIHDHQISGGVNYFINSFCVWNCFIMARMVSKIYVERYCQCQRVIVLSHGIEYEQAVLWFTLVLTGGWMCEVGRGVVSRRGCSS